MATTKTKEERQPRSSTPAVVAEPHEEVEVEVEGTSAFEETEIVVDAEIEEEVLIEGQEIPTADEVEAEIVVEEDDPALEGEVNRTVVLDVAQPQTKSLAKKTQAPGLPVKADKDTSQLNLLQRYFRELRKYPLLSPEEEHELAVEFQKNDDPDLAFRLTTANLRLVVKIAMEYQSAVANLLDLIQEGNVGLMQAVKKFDPYRGIRLSSYAQWWIRAYILKYLVNNARLVKIGTTQAQRKLFFNLRKEKEKLESLGFMPTPALLAERLDVREEDVTEMEQRMARSDLSLDLPVGDDQKHTIGDLMPSEGVDAEDIVIGSDLREQIRYHMGIFSRTLKEREQVLWEKRLTSDEPLTLQEIGDIFGVTRERARQIEKEMISRFREYLQRELPDLEAFDFIPGAP